jgi:hypothetical protein
VKIVPGGTPPDDGLEEWSCLAALSLNLVSAVDKLRAVWGESLCLSETISFFFFFFFFGGTGA